MKTRILFVPLIVLLLFSCTQPDLPKVVSGEIERIENFESQFVTQRNIDIWLPEGYDTKKKYPVLYMHDGQMLFDSSTTWNKQAWDIDDVASNLIAENQIRDFIVVGIWNGDTTRHYDYFPQKPFESLSSIQKDTVSSQLRKVNICKEEFEPLSDNYLQFIVKELKPHIDKTYSVHSDRNNTYIMGSSMGGLISMYAICEYPEVFGKAACLSTHWIGTFTDKNNPVPKSFLSYLTTHLPNPKTHSIYFDCGDQTLDKYYPDLQVKVDSILISKVYTDQNWTTGYHPGEDHSEIAWNKRLHLPLQFLLSK